MTGDVKSFADRLYDTLRMARISYDEVMQLRLFIEPGMAAAAAEHRTEKEIGELEETIVSREKPVKAGKSRPLQI